MNHKRKHRKWSGLCSCKSYKQAGNSKNRRRDKEQAVRVRMKRLED